MHVFGHMFKDHAISDYAWFCYIWDMCERENKVRRSVHSFLLPKISKHTFYLSILICIYVLDDTHDHTNLCLNLNNIT